MPSPESSGGQDLDDRFIRGFPRAEDQVDEHYGVADHAQAAQALAAGVAVLPAGSGRARLGWYGLSSFLSDIKALGLPSGVRKKLSTGRARKTAEARDRVFLTTHSAAESSICRRR